MWQALLAAAVAGSGILAKKIFVDRDPHEPISNVEPNQNLNSSVPEDSVFTCKDGFFEDHIAAKNDGSIFRFSSASSPHKRPKMLKKKMKELKRNVKGKEGIKWSAVGCCKQGWVVDQRKNGSSKRLSFCVKKRRISKNVNGKCQSCSSEGNSLFTWGLSVGMMYMMSAGKTEINKLYYSMDETAKIVQELKAELHRRKSLSKQFGSTDAQMTIPKSNPHSTDTGEGGECSSSVLTEDQQMEALGMDQLEAELEFELEKLPWNSQEAFECDDMVRDFLPTYDEDMISHHFTGIQPSELDEKLSHLLIEQQESHITDLEAKLEHTHTKLRDKEAELQALKDCVRRLTQVSLKDEDAESQIEDEEANVEDQEQEISCSTTSMVGMKRAMNFK